MRHTQGTQEVVTTTTLTVVPAAVSAQHCTLSPLAVRGYAVNGSELLGTAGAVGAVQLTLADTFGNGPLATDPGSVAVTVTSTRSFRIPVDVTVADDGVVCARFAAEPTGSYTVAAALVPPFGAAAPVGEIDLTVAAAHADLGRSSVSGLGPSLPAGARTGFVVRVRDAFGNAVRGPAALGAAERCLRLKLDAEGDDAPALVPYTLSAAANGSANVSFVASCAGSLTVVCAGDGQLLLDALTGAYTPGHWPSAGASVNLCSLNGALHVSDTAAKQLVKRSLYCGPSRAGLRPPQEPFTHTCKACLAQSGGALSHTNAGYKTQQVSCCCGIT